MDKPEDKELPDLSESIPLVETQQKGTSLFVHEGLTSLEKSEAKEEPTTQLNEQTPTKKIHEREGGSSELDGALVTTSFDKPDLSSLNKQEDKELLNLSESNPLVETQEKGTSLFVHEGLTSLEKSEAKEEPATQLNEQTPTDNTHETGGALREEEGSSLDKPEDKELPDLSESIPLVETQEKGTSLFVHEGLTSLEKSEAKEEPATQLNEQTPTENTHETGGALREEEGSSLDKPEDKELPNLSESIPLVETQEKGTSLFVHEGLTSLEKSEAKEEPTTQLNEQTPTKKIHEREGGSSELDGALVTTSFDKPDLSSLNKQEDKELLDLSESNPLVETQEKGTSLFVHEGLTSLEKSEAKEEPATQLNEQTPTENTHETGGALREEEGSSLDKPEDKELPNLSESIPLVETQEKGTSLFVHEGLTSLEKSEAKEEPTTQLNEQTPTKKIHEREGGSSELDRALVTTSFDKPEQESGDITFLLAIPAKTQKCMQKRMQERTNSSVNWEEEVQIMYLTQGDIDAQEEKVSKLKAMVDIFSVHSAQKRNLSGLLDSMIDNIVNGRSERSDGEMEVRSFYGLESTEKTKIQKLSSLAVEGEMIRM